MISWRYPRRPPPGRPAPLGRAALSRAPPAWAFESIAVVRSATEALYKLGARAHPGPRKSRPPAPPPVSSLCADRDTTGALTNRSLSFVGAAFIFVARLLSPSRASSCGWNVGASKQLQR